LKNDSKVMLFGRRVFNRLRRMNVFPFTLVYSVVSAALKAVELKLLCPAVWPGEASGAAEALPCGVMLWLERIANRRVERQFDLCLALRSEDANDRLHDAFSVMLTSPRLRSVGFYWDLQRLADDLSLLQWPRRHEPNAQPAYERLGSPSLNQFEEFLRSSHEGIALPIAATRDAQTLLKRQVGGALAVCLNLPVGLQPLAAAISAACPAVQFVDLSACPGNAGCAVNSRSLHAYGLGLHERMALAQTADAYVGAFDELGCTAIVSGRPAVLFAGVSGEHLHPIRQDEATMWVCGPMEPTALSQAVVQFLALRLGLDEIDGRLYRN